MKTTLKMLCLFVLAVAFFGCSTSDLKIVTSQKTDNYKIVLLSQSGSIKEGAGQFYLEFYDSGNQLVDVGTVRIRAEMPMPGMPMVNEAKVETTDSPGRYIVEYIMTMSGTWTLNIQFGKNNFASMTITVS